MDWTAIAAEAGRIMLAALVVYIWLLLLTRMAGLRSFSRMSGFDFAITVATGTTLASTIVSPQVDWWRGMVALAALFALQVLVAVGRRRGRFEVAVDNQPLLLMAGGRVLADNLRRARLTHGDLMAKLRENSVRRLEDVAAVVFETTGTVSVIHGPGPLQAEVLERVRDRDIALGARA